MLPLTLACTAVSAAEAAPRTVVDMARIVGVVAAGAPIDLARLVRQKR